MRGLPLLALLLGCGGAPAGVPFNYPLDGELRLQHVQAKGTHNSYHVETTSGRVSDWRYTHPPLDEQLALGARQVELDVSLDSDVGYFEVYHVPLADEGTTCRKLTDCLEAMRRWSERYPGHHPIYVQIEPKDGFLPERAEAYFKRLEDEIRSAWPEERILTPAQVQGEAPSLREALLQRGWPTLSTLRGKVLFAFDNTGEVRRAYTHGERDLAGRLLFVDSRPDQPFAAVAVLNDPVADGPAIRAALAAGLLVRTRADADSVEPLRGDRSRMEAALASGAQWISTDYLVPMTGISYVLEVPGGTPSRCDPVTAPPRCTSLALEDPAFVGGPAQ